MKKLLMFTVLMAALGTPIAQAEKVVVQDALPGQNIDFANQNTIPGVRFAARIHFNAALSDGCSVTQQIDTSIPGEDIGQPMLESTTRHIDMQFGDVIDAFGIFKSDGQIAYIRGELMCLRHPQRDDMVRVIIRASDNVNLESQ